MKAPLSALRALSALQAAPALLAVLGLLGAHPARAQTVPASDRSVLVSDGILRGSPRMMGVAGAFVGIGEGGEGLFRNPAAAASRDVAFPPGLNAGIGFTFHLLPESQAATQDWDNDGRPDMRLEPGRPHTLGHQVAYASLQLQNGRWGAGVGLDVANDPAVDGPRGMDLALVRGFAVAGYALGDDDLLLAGGLSSLSAVVGRFEARALRKVDATLGLGAELGGLYRPHGQNYRLGMALFSGMRTGAFDDAVTAEVPLSFSRAESPTRLLLGGSYAFGEGRPYNISNRNGWVMSTKTHAPSAVLLRTVVTAQLDVNFPVGGAALPNDLLQALPGEATPLAGDRITVEPRIGIEREVREGELRMRSGAYLEPPALALGTPRLHVTFGGELYLLRVLRWPISFGLTLDVAASYLNLSVAPLIWN